MMSSVPQSLLQQGRSLTRLHLRFKELHVLGLHVFSMYHSFCLIPLFMSMHACGGPHYAMSCKGTRKTSLNGGLRFVAKVVPPLCMQTQTSFKPGW